MFWNFGSMLWGWEMKWVMLERYKTKVDSHDQHCCDDPQVGGAAPYPDEEEATLVSQLIPDIANVTLTKISQQNHRQFMNVHDLSFHDIPLEIEIDIDVDIDIEYRTIHIIYIYIDNDDDDSDYSHIYIYIIIYIYWKKYISNYKHIIYLYFHNFPDVWCRMCFLLGSLVRTRWCRTTTQPGGQH